MPESDAGDLLRQGAAAAGGPPGSTAAELDQLRALLLEAERRQLDDLSDRLEELEGIRTQILDVDRNEMRRLREAIEALEARLGDVSARTEQVSDVLPGAIRHRRDARNDLTDALRPDIEQALHDSIRRDPTVMAEALYPVMGPTIRKLIVSLFSFDQVHAGATYRVSHAYLIDRRTSLPLAVHAPEGGAHEADMVSGMMEALRSFVQDAFEAADFDGLHDLRVGEVNLWIEWGPQAVLAVVVRGQAPDELRIEMQETLEAFHRTYRNDLDAFAGDAAPFESMAQKLADLTGSLTKQGEPSRVRKLIPIAVLVTILVGVAWLIWILVT